jgi:hypothetical protein
LFDWVLQGGDVLGLFCLMFDVFMLLSKEPAGTFFLAQHQTSNIEHQTTAR